MCGMPRQCPVSVQYADERQPIVPIPQPAPGGAVRGTANPSDRGEPSSISLELGLLLLNKGMIRAVKIIGRHADGLRLCFSLDSLVDAHIPFLLQHFLGHGVSER